MSTKGWMQVFLKKYDPYTGKALLNAYNLLKLNIFKLSLNWVFINEDPYQIPYAQGMLLFAASI